MSDVFRPGGVVPCEEVMLLDYEYRVVFTPLTKYGTSSGFVFEDRLGAMSLRVAKATLADHIANIGDADTAIILERSPIAGDTWTVVSDGD